jgi:hypothetical protein
MYGEVQRDYGRVRWKNLTINVPRCVMCKDRRSWRNGAVAAGLAILIAATVLSLFGGDPLVGLFFAGAVLVASIVAGVTGGPFRRAVREFPPIQERRAQGWMFGAKPPGVN